LLHNFFIWQHACRNIIQQLQVIVLLSTLSWRSHMICSGGGLDSMLIAWARQHGLQICLHTNWLLVDIIHNLSSFGHVVKVHECILLHHLIDIQVFLEERNGSLSILHSLCCSKCCRLVNGLVVV
jgi:hypothetical protein